MNDETAIDEISDTILPTRLANLRERTPSDIEGQVLAIGSKSTREELFAALNAAEWLIARARSIDRIMKQLAIGWIDENGEFDIGPMHYSVGFSISVKCLNVQQTGRAVLEAAGGEIDRLLSVLVAQPFKYSAVRNCIEKKLYNTLFMPYRSGRLINGVPERLLKRSDPTFVRRAAH